MISPDKKTGFTLVELLIGVALVAILVPVIAFIYYTSSASSRLGSAQIKLQLDGRRSLTTMAGFIKLAKEVVTSSQGYTTDSNTLILHVPGVDSNQTLLSGNDVFVFDYNASAKQLKQQIFPTAGSLRPAGITTVGSDVDSIIFRFFDRDQQLICVSSVSKRWWQVGRAYAAAICDGAINYTLTALVKIELTFKKPVGNKEAKVTLTDEVRLRNK